MIGARRGFRRALTLLVNGGRVCCCGEGVALFLYILFKLTPCILQCPMLLSKHERRIECRNRRRIERRNIDETE